MPEQGGGGTDRHPRRRDAAPGLIAALLLCLAGGFALTSTPDETWIEGGIELRLDGLDADFGPDVARFPVGFSATGVETTSGVEALGWAGLAGSVAIAATRGRSRRIAGAALLAVGLAATFVVGRVAVDPFNAYRAHVGLPAADDPVGTHRTQWVWIALAGALALLAAGVLTTRYGPRWPALGGRYDRTEQPDDAWAALDRGEDPTEA